MPFHRVLFGVAIAIGLAMASQTGAQSKPLVIATWNVAWLGNAPFSNLDEVKVCEAQDRAKVPLDKREPEQCRRGSPYRMAGAYSLLARNAQQFDFDIIGLQEVEGLSAVQMLFGEKPLSSGDKAKFVAKGTYQLAVNPEGGWQKVGIAVKASLLAPGTQISAVPYTELGAPLERDKRSGLDVTIPLKSGPLRVLVVHLKSGCQRAPLNSVGDAAASCGPLAKQGPVLQRWIDARQAERQPFIVLGDFNRVLASSASHEACPASGDCGATAFHPWVDRNGLNQAPVIVPTAAIEHMDGCFAKAHGRATIDQVVLGGGAEQGYVASSARGHQYIDPRTGQPITDKSKTRLYSDHCPVSINWRP